MKNVTVLNDNFLVKCIVETPTSSLGLILNSEEQETIYGIVVDGPKYIGKEISILTKTNKIIIDHEIYYILKEKDILSSAL